MTQLQAEQVLLHVKDNALDTPFDRLKETIQWLRLSQRHVILIYRLLGASDDQELVEFEFVQAFVACAMSSSSRG